MFAQEARADCTIPPGVETDVFYNDSFKGLQYCDGTKWIAMHGRGSGSGGCTDPAGSAGAIVYNSAARVFQGCGGSIWRAMGPVGGAGSPHVGSCSDPGGLAGRLVYNSVFHVLQYCDGADWVSIGKVFDVTPDGFGFSELTDVAQGVTVESVEIVQINGLDVAAVVSIAGDGAPMYRVCNDASCTEVDVDWSNGAGLIENGQYLQLRLTSSASSRTTYSAAIAVGAGNVQWDVTTVGDTIPDAFSFTDQTDAAISTQIESNILQITGMDDGTAISISGGGGEYRICTDGTSDANCDGSEIQAWTSGASTIDANQYVQLRLMSSASNSTMVSTTLTVGVSNDQWDVTTIAPACGGVMVGGYCWYLGGPYDNCDDACSTHGGCNLAGTKDYAGSGGSDANCQAVLVALGYPAGAVLGQSTTAGCFFNAVSIKRMRGSITTTCAASNAKFRRACACNN